MKAKHFDDRDRGQVGIGTLIVFIALVLVAAIAAGVLINTAGFLQSQSEQTGQESTSQVTDRLQAVSITGDEIQDGDITNVEVTVSKAPGAQDIDLRNVTVQWVGPDGTFNLINDRTTTDTYYVSYTDATGTEGVTDFDDGVSDITINGGTFSTSADVRDNDTVTKKDVEDEIEASGQVNGNDIDSATLYTLSDSFRMEAFKDADGSFPVLSDSDDRFIIAFEPGVEFGQETATESAFTRGSGLGEGQSVEVRVTTESGSTSVIRLSAPDSLSGQSAVAL